VSHVIFERIDGVVVKDESIFEKVEALNVQVVVNFFLLEAIESVEDARLCRAGSGIGDRDRVWPSGRRGADADAR